MIINIGDKDGFANAIKTINSLKFRFNNKLKYTNAQKIAKNIL
jgi:hypothetical protein